MKNFVEVNGSDHLNIIFNELIENFEQMKLKNQEQNDIRSFFRSWIYFFIYTIYSYGIAPKIKISIYSGHLIKADTFLGTSGVRYGQVWLYWNFFYFKNEFC